MKLGPVTISHGRFGVSVLTLLSFVAGVVIWLVQTVYADYAETKIKAGDAATKIDLIAAKIDAQSVNRDIKLKAIDDKIDMVRDGVNEMNGKLGRIEDRFDRMIELTRKGP